MKKWLVKKKREREEKEEEEKRTPARDVRVGGSESSALPHVVALTRLIKNCEQEFTTNSRHSPRRDV